MPRGGSGVRLVGSARRIRGTAMAFVARLAGRCIVARLRSGLRTRGSRARGRRTGGTLACSCLPARLNFGQNVSMVTTLGLVRPPDLRDEALDPPREQAGVDLPVHDGEESFAVGGILGNLRSGPSFSPFEELGVVERTQPFAVLLEYLRGWSPAKESLSGRARTGPRVQVCDGGVAVHRQDQLIETVRGWLHGRAKRREAHGARRMWGQPMAGVERHHWSTTNVTRVRRRHLAQSIRGLPWVHERFLMPLAYPRVAGRSTQCEAPHATSHEPTGNAHRPGRGRVLVRLVEHRDRDGGQVARW